MLHHHFICVTNLLTPSSRDKNKYTIRNAHKEGKWVGICGELAADTTLTKTFLDMGVDELSVAASAVLKVRKAIRQA
jgi:phosphoenolpyruvate-protein kinase (PTS system EI component)